MCHLQSEKIVKTLGIMKIIEEGELEQTPETPRIKDLAIKSQIHLLLQISFHLRGRKKSNN